MILRSLTKHVKDQNWFAVWLDFLIVVIGVYIGIQVSNWNATQLQRAEEGALLQRLQADFVRIQEDAEFSLSFHQSLVADLTALVLALKAEALPAKDAAAFERALSKGLVVQTSADRSGTFSELLASGRVNILRDKELLNELVAYEDFLQRHATALQYLTGRLRGVQVPFLSDFTYELDARTNAIDQMTSTLGFMIEAYDFKSMASDPGFVSAAQEVLLVQSALGMWRQRIMQRIEAIRGRLSAK